MRSNPHSPPEPLLSPSLWGQERRAPRPDDRGGPFGQRGVPLAAGAPATPSPLSPVLLAVGSDPVSDVRYRSMCELSQSQNAVLVLKKPEIFPATSGVDSQGARFQCC